MVNQATTKGLSKWVQLSTSRSVAAQRLVGTHWAAGESARRFRPCFCFLTKETMSFLATKRSLRHPTVVQTYRCRLLQTCAWKRPRIRATRPDRSYPAQHMRLSSPITRLSSRYHRHSPANEADRTLPPLPRGEGRKQGFKSQAAAPTQACPTAVTCM